MSQNRDTRRRVWGPVTRLREAEAAHLPFETADTHGDVLQAVKRRASEPAQVQVGESDSDLPQLDDEVLEYLCPDYTHYALGYHKPYSEGPLQLPFQRPHQRCRKFSSPAVEKVVDDLYSNLKDRDLAQIFRNAFPNTLDTTVRWHVDGDKTHAPKSGLRRDQDRWEGAQSFIVTGDINAEWLRDSTNQLSQYQSLASTSPDISNLLLGAINTQAEFVIQSPYCNAFQPPSSSGLEPVRSGMEDAVHPAYEYSVVFECKYELDSLANFLSLSNQYHAATGSTAFLTARWFKALKTLLRVLDAQSRPTFDSATQKYLHNEYTFSRYTSSSTETLSLRGIGNPLADNTGLVRSAFRPSDDATVFGFLIPANAMMSVELNRTSHILSEYARTAPTLPIPDDVSQIAADLATRSQRIRQGIYDHAVIDHPVHGKVFAYEVDGYGSRLLMDDANIPSLLALPLLGFVDTSDEVYQNTRRMVLSPANPYYLSGRHFAGIGGPHVGVRNAWPMSVLVQAMTASNNDSEIIECLERVKNVSIFGLINESVNVDTGVSAVVGDGMTRAWFAWANSVFAQTILFLAEHKPELVLSEGVGRYVVGKGTYERES
ncbi:hypothetical protein DV738_g4717, partial [Chaetothyriales sp. CBS 135597]